MVNAANTLVSASPVQTARTSPSPRRGRNNVALVSAALNYDAECSMLAAGRSLADVMAFAAARGDSVSPCDLAAESARTILGSSAPTSRPMHADYTRETVAL